MARPVHHLPPRAGARFVRQATSLMPLRTPSRPRTVNWRRTGSPTPRSLLEPHNLGVGPLLLVAIVPAVVRLDACRDGYD